jgi:hypothetical protein
MTDESELDEEFEKEQAFERAEAAESMRWKLVCALLRALCPEEADAALVRLFDTESPTTARIMETGEVFICTSDGGEVYITKAANPTLGLVIHEYYGEYMEARRETRNAAAVTYHTSERT